MFRANFLTSPLLTSVLTTALFTSTQLGGSATSYADPNPRVDSDVVSDVAERTSLSVVSITTEGTLSNVQGPHGMGQMPPWFFFGPEGPPQRGRGHGPGPRMRDTIPLGLASGVVISADGYIVTNNHVVAKAKTIKVKFPDQRQLEAKLVGTDEPTDLALLKVDARGLKALSFGDSAKLRLGQTVLALGNPFGVGQTVTMGIVSAKGRSNVGIVDYEDFVQTDAAINPGNSGGALVNLDGELIGINTAILSKSGGAQGVGFAVPSSMVKPVIAQIREHGHVARGWLGVAIQDLTPELQKAMRLDEVQGVLVSDVVENGPAAKAGVRSGDVVIRVNDRPMEQASTLRNAIALLGPGTRAELALLQEGKKRSITVTLAEKEEGRIAAQGGSPSDQAGVLSGLSLQDLTPDLRRKLEIPAKIEGGIVVTDVDPESAAGRSGLEEGDVVIGVNRRPIQSVANLRSLNLEKTKTDQVLFRIYRNGTFLFLVIRN